MPSQLAAGQEFAIGAIQSSPDGVVCSGTLIAPHWVLSAAHCQRLESLSFRTGRDGQNITVAVVRAFPHPDRDVVLFELTSEARLSERGVRPIALFQGGIGAEWIGREVTLGGFGLTETGRGGERRFAVAPIVSISSQLIAVDGQGTRGACHGDSGGPLLADTQGELIGVLSTGSTSCVGVDRYERVDTLVEWVRATIEQAGVSPCGELDAEGSCTSGRALWCSGGQIATEDCLGKQSCGYDLDRGGYRCMAEGLDPCEGVGALPECFDNVVVRCRAGELIRENCAECGQRCVLQGDEAVCQ